MGMGLEERFERYGEALVAARMRPQAVCATHPSMHHLGVDLELERRGDIGRGGRSGSAGIDTRRCRGLLLDHRRHRLSEERHALGGRGAPVMRADGQDGQLQGGGESVAYKAELIHRRSWPNRHTLEWTTLTG